MKNYKICPKCYRIHDGDDIKCKFKDCEYSLENVQFATQNELVENKKQKIINKYIEEIDDVIAVSKSSSNIIDVYRGRILLELLQNAHDAAVNHRDKDSYVKITFFDGVLEFYNSGTPFHYDGVRSLFTPHFSIREFEDEDTDDHEKKNEDYIGHFGLGFRSILNWGNEISIISTSGLSIHYSPKNVLDMQKRVKENQDQYNRIIGFADGSKSTLFEKYPIPLLTAPSIIDDKIKDDKYDTMIRIVCFEDKYDEIYEELSKFSSQDVAFLNIFKEIIIQTEHINKTINRKKLNVSEIIINDEKIQKSVISFLTGSILDTYTRFKISGYNNDLGMIYNCAIAFSNHDLEKNNISIYFKTKHENKFPFLVHGSFDLREDREYIKETPNTLYVFEKLSKLIVDVILNEKLNLDHVNYEALEMLVCDTDFFPFSQTYRFYMDYIKKQKCFPTVNNKYRLNDSSNVLVFPFNEPRLSLILKGNKFDDLLIFTENEKIISFLKLLDVEFYTQNHLADLIDETILNYTLEDKTKLIYYFIKIFNKTSDNYPKLIVDTNNQSVLDSNGLFNLPTTQELRELPEFIQLKFINEKMWNDLQSNECFNITSVNKVRGLLERIEPFGVDEYSFTKIFPLIKKEFESQTITNDQKKVVIKWLQKYLINNIENFSSVFPILQKEMSDSNYGEVFIKENHQWLFDLFSNHQEVKEYRESKNIIVLCKVKKKIVLSDAINTYFPDYYDNKVGYALLKYADVDFLAGTSYYGFKNTDLNLIKEYFIWLGVNIFPKKIIIDIKNTDFLEYGKYCFGSDYDTLLKDKFSISNLGRVETIQNIDTILTKSNFNEIMYWLLLMDGKEKSFLSNENETYPDSFLNYYYAYSQNYQRKDTLRKTYKQLKNYIRYKFYTAKWLEVEDSNIKIAPKSATFSTYGLAPMFYKPKIDYRHFSKINLSWTEEKINTILVDIGVNSRIGLLDERRKYKLLSNLEELDKTCRFTRSIYNEVIKDNETSVEELNKSLFNTEEYIDFINNGKIAVIKNYRKQYVPVKESYYADNRELCEGITKNINILDLELRKGVDQVTTILGTQKLQDFDIKFVNEPKWSELNQEFKEKYLELLPFIIVKRNQKIKNIKPEIAKLKNCEVKLILNETISYKVDNETIKYQLEDFEYIYFDKLNKGYIVAPTRFKTCEDLFNNREFADSLAELITLILGVYDGKESYREFIGLSNEDRERTVIKDYNLNGIEILQTIRIEFNITMSRKTIFWNTIKQLIGKNKFAGISKQYIDNDNINYEDYSDINNIQLFMQLFQQIKLDFDQFNSNCKYQIRSEKYWQENYEIIKNKYKDNYKSYLYLQRIFNIKSMEDVQKFYKDVQDFQFSRFSTYNSPLKSPISEYLYNTFKVNLKTLEKEEVLDFDTIIQTNINQYNNDHPEKYHKIVKIKAKEEIMRFALLNKIDLLEINENSNEDKSKNAKAILINYNELDDEADRASKAHQINADNIQSMISKDNKSNKDNENHLPKSNSSDADDINQRKLENGYLAERFVYNQLVNEMEDYNVKWISKYSYYGIGNKEYNDNAHYDIEYYDKNGKHHYIEVKSSSDANIRIEISKEEVEFGLSHKQEYDIYYIRIKERKIQSDPSKFEKIFVFDKLQNFLENDKFSVDYKTFILKGKIKKN